MLDIARSGRYNKHIKWRCDKRLAPYRIVFIRNRHRPGWRFLLFMINCNISFRNVRVIVSRIRSTPFRDGVSSPPAVFVQRPGTSVEAPPTQ